VSISIVEHESILIGLILFNQWSDDRQGFVPERSQSIHYGQTSGSPPENRG